MKSDRFIQGILISDEDDILSYRLPHNDPKLKKAVKRLRRLKKNLKSLKNYPGHRQDSQPPHYAIFSKTNVQGNVEEAITDVRQRLRAKRL